MGLNSLDLLLCFSKRDSFVVLAKFIISVKLSIIGPVLGQCLQALLGFLLGFVSLSTQVGDLIFKVGIGHLKLRY